VILTVYQKQSELIRDLCTLWTNGIDLDCTYSKGVFYKDGLAPKPKLKSDILPLSDLDFVASADTLPLRNCSVNSVIFDPPFQADYRRCDKSDSDKGLIGKRFSSFKRLEDLLGFYQGCLVEFYRVLTKHGKVIFKCQDTTYGHKQFLTHCAVVSMAEKIGYKVVDLFILLNKNPIIDPKWKHQEHARKAHSYFLVLSA